MLVRVDVLIREAGSDETNLTVAIIHPGMPRDPDEPGLDELIARAEAFV